MAKWDPWEWFKSNVVEPVSDFVGRAAKAIGTTFEKIVSTVGKTIEGVLKNPLPTIATIGLTMMGVPAHLANAMVTAATGGDMEQIVLSAAASYVGGKIGQQVGGAFAPDEIVGGAWGDEAFSSTFKPDLSQQLFQKIGIELYLIITNFTLPFLNDYLKKMDIVFPKVLKRKAIVLPVISILVALYVTSLLIGL